MMEEKKVCLENPKFILGFHHVFNVQLGLIVGLLSISWAHKLRMWLLAAPDSLATRAEGGPLPLASVSGFQRTLISPAWTVPRAHPGPRLESEQILCVNLMGPTLWVACSHATPGPSCDMENPPKSQRATATPVYFSSRGQKRLLSPAYRRGLLSGQDPPEHSSLFFLDVALLTDSSWSCVCDSFGVCNSTCCPWVLKVHLSL